jgi:hypothetical protein
VEKLTAGIVPLKVWIVSISSHSAIPQPWGSINHSLALAGGPANTVNFSKYPEGSAGSG